MGLCVTRYSSKKEPVKVEMDMTVTKSSKKMSEKVDIGYCECGENCDPNTDDCETEGGGCGKPLHFCGECFKLIKKEGDNCSCGWAKKKLGKAQRRQF